MSDLRVGGLVPRLTGRWLGFPTVNSAFDLALRQSFGCRADAGELWQLDRLNHGRNEYRPAVLFF